MKTFIKKAQIGQIVESEKLGIKGKVSEVLGYADTLENMHPDELKAEVILLEKALGENYRDLYFECVVEIKEATPESEFAGDKIAVLGWQEFQTCAILEV